MRMLLFRRAVAEFLGTAWLVFGGCGSAVLAAGFPNVGIGLLGVSFAFGLTVLTMAYTLDLFLVVTLILLSQLVYGREAVLRHRSFMRILLRRCLGVLQAPGFST